MRSRRFTMLLPVLTFALVLGGLPTAGAAGTPYCGITWGSLDKYDPAMMSGAPLTGARVGRHDCWDRLVIDLGGSPAAGYNARYTDAFRAEATGDVLATAGGAVLSISVHAWSWDFSTNQPSVFWRDSIVRPEQFSAGGYRTFRDLVFGGTFEGYSSIGIGVRARLPFRVFKLDGPGGGSRLVVDVAHQW